MRPIQQFKQNINEIQKISDLYKFNKQQFNNAVDIDGLLRMELVMGVSALDQYIHQVVVERVIDILRNRGKIPVNFSKLLLSYDSLNDVLQSGNIQDAIVLIERDLRLKMSWRSFQQPDKITEALKYISDHNVWKEISILMNREVSAVKQQLELIVKRRDCIAHEADYDYINLCQYPISDVMCTTAVNFIIELVFMIDAMIFEYTYTVSEVLKFE